MRDNGPVTQREIEFDDQEIIVSGTDPAGRITFVNRAFVRISGYDEADLLGAAHNILRHPDMPAAAFADLWATVKAGHPWEGMVKNRTKNGDHYWVRANVTPTTTAGQITGYISIRTKPSRADVAAAEKLYAEMRRGRLRGRILRGGDLRLTGLRGRLARLKNSVVGRLAVALTVLTLLLLLAGGLGLAGMAAFETDLQRVFDDNLAPALDLATISDLSDGIDRAVNHHARDLEPSDPMALTALLERIAADEATMTRLWTGYVAGEHPDDERALQQSYLRHRESWRRDGLEPALALLRSGDGVGLRRQLDQVAAPLFAASHESLRALLDYQRGDAAALRTAAAAALAGHWRYAGGGLTLAVLLALALAFWVLRSLRPPLAVLPRHFDAIAAGDLTYTIPPTGVIEFDMLGSALRALKARIAYFVLEREELSRRAETILRQEMLTLTELLEGEVQETVGDISAQAQHLSVGAADLSRVAADLLDQAQTVAASVEVTRSNVETVATASARLDEASSRISAQVGEGATLAEAARSRADAAAQSVDGVNEATARIGGVVGLIQGIAGQTRMLALNATIEAARAGETGRGFAVVADEVKTLADQTGQAIGAVNHQAEQIGDTTREAVETVRAVAGTIREIDAISAGIARAVDLQHAATAEITASAAQAADHTRAVADKVAGMIAGAETTGAVAVRVNDLSAMVSRDIAALKRRLYVILRTSYGGDRRMEPRIPVALPVRADFAEGSCSGFTGDLSPGGAFLLGPGAAQLGGRGWVDLEGVGRIEAERVGADPLGAHLRFLAPSPDVVARLRQRIGQEVTADAPLRALADSVAAEAGALWDGALDRGEISFEDLFEGEYDPIPGTDPLQVMARHTAVADVLFPPLLEAALTRHPGVTVCVMTDRNGYIAVNNQEWSQPQRPGDRSWNLMYSRNRRIFDDRAGILAARCLKPMMQTYPRDLGGGRFSFLKEAVAPVLVRGKRWGAIRIHVRLGTD